jgi:hypothetical protein
LGLPELAKEAVAPEEVIVDGEIGWDPIRSRR